MKEGSVKLANFENYLYVGKSVNFDTFSVANTHKEDKLSVLSANDSNMIEVEEFIDK